MSESLVDPQAALTATRARLDQLQARYHEEARNPSSFAAAWTANLELLAALAVDRVLVARVNNDVLAFADADLLARSIAVEIEKAQTALGSLDRVAALAALDRCWALLDAPVP